jgi:hypothetical protein
MADRVRVFAIVGDYSIRSLVTGTMIAIGCIVAFFCALFGATGRFGHRIPRFRPLDQSSERNSFQSQNTAVFVGRSVKSFTPR